MITPTGIGIVAGKILTLLENRKTVLSVDGIKSRLDEPAELVDMALGWLVREGLVMMVPRQNEEVVQDNSSSGLTLHGLMSDGFTPAGFRDDPD
ncbi:MAG: hypothetical protein A3C36_05085 [Omnitrophica WOR_2 bacterium RIFCSPHIGHO2_02_FULL_52_10]|nr:MAG: hypothetical protein A3C36_05085 [Omnitrophica WOR_2 bacterium RIFCSPHIGHO2_02_FULL_52_10]